MLATARKIDTEEEALQIVRILDLLQEWEFPPEVPDYVEVEYIDPDFDWICSRPVKGERGG